MPFTSESFRSRHNKKLDSKAATKASDMANAMIRRGVDEGIAIATANKYGNRVNRGGGTFKEHNRRSRES